MKTPESTMGCCVPETSAGNKLVDCDHNAVIADADSNQKSSAKMIALSGGWFRMGANDSAHPEDGEAPEREVFIDGFALDATAVTINEFAVFVKATGFRTLAERLGSSFVFYAHCDPDAAFPAVSNAPWWRDVPGACWYSPYGKWKGTGLDGNHPVTHISREDALAYCAWSKFRLPTEAEWEFAARGQLVGKPFPWGDELEPQGEHRANVWQGVFPEHNRCDDGYTGTAPVDAYGAFGYGHFNMIGNVWEWVADRHTTLHSPRKVRNPKGPLNGSNYVAKGGSYLCHASYCARYRTSSRQALPAGTTTGNVGFRVAMDVDQHAASPG